MRGRERELALYELMGAGAVISLGLILAFHSFVAFVSPFLLVIAGFVVGMLVWARAKPEDDLPDPSWVQRRSDRFRAAIADRSDSDRSLGANLRKVGILHTSEVVLGRWKGLSADWRTRAWLVLTQERLFLIPFDVVTSRVSARQPEWEVRIDVATNPRRTDFRLNPPRRTPNFGVGNQISYLWAFSIQEASEAILAARELYPAR